MACEAVDMPRECHAVSAVHYLPCIFVLQTPNCAAKALCLYPFHLPCVCTVE